MRSCPFWRLEQNLGTSFGALFLEKSATRIKLEENFTHRFVSTKKSSEVVMTVAASNQSPSIGEDPHEDYPYK